MSAAYQYLTKKYIDSGLLDKDGNPVISNKSVWNPFIYPDSGYIPPCSVCESGYDDYMKQHDAGVKVKDLLWPHFRCGCLWSEYFESKIKQVNPDMKFKDR